MAGRPYWQELNGTCTAMWITEYLTRDHARLHSLLDECLATRDLGDVFERFRGGLLRHIAIEEKLLFPAVRRALGGEALPSAWELRIEHAALTSLMVPTPDAALCEEIGSLLRDHDQKEEGSRGVYAECEQVLAPDESEKVAATASSFPGIPLAAHFDGPGTCRTAADALHAAQRIRRRR
jgi:hypothetical protein